ncbi:MAG: hypothetical protein LBR65_08010, partial [Culturomica sp.]|nr:hypothetical protein [Culturomica sp.]
MKKLVLALFLLGIILSAYSQEKFIDGFTLRQSFQSRDERAEPAVLAFTKPKDKAESWLLNAAIGYNFLHNKDIDLILDGFFEYHKNTLIEKIQDNWQIGISSEWTSRDLPQKKWSPVFITAIKYHEDRIKKNTSLQGNIYFTPLFNGRGGKPKYFWIPNISSDFGKAFRFSYSPYIGLENENRLKTKKDSSAGSIYRLLFRVTSTISLLPKHEKLKEKFEFNIDWQYRNNFSENVKDLITVE